MDQEKDTLQRTDERRTWDERVRADGSLAENDEAGTEAVGAGAGALGGAAVGAVVGGPPGAVVGGLAGAAGGAGLGDKAEEEIEEENAKPADERR